MKFLVITKIPERQGLLGPIKGINVINEVEADDVDAVREGLQVPLNGECIIVAKEQATIVRARVVNEVV